MRKLWLIPLAFAAILMALFLARARLAGELAQGYFRQHGIASDIDFDRLGLSGISGRVSLGPANSPDFYADAVELDFDPLRLMPVIVEVRLINPVVRARLEADGRFTLPSLQAWLDSLSSTEGAHSRYVSDELAISFSHLRVLLATPGGAAELDGEAKIKRSQVVSAVIAAKPTTIIWRGTIVRVAEASLRLDPVGGGYGVAAHFAVALKNSSLEATDVTAQLSAPSVNWDLTAKSLSVPALHLQIKAGSMNADGTVATMPTFELTANSVHAILNNGTPEGGAKLAVLVPTLHLQIKAESLNTGGITAAKPTLDLTADAVRATLNNGVPTSSAKLAVNAGAGFSPPAFAKLFPGLMKEPRLVQALQSNLKHLDLVLNANFAQQKGIFSLSLNNPSDLRGARGGHLRLTSLALNGPPSALRGNFNAALSGTDLPSLTLRSHSFLIADGGFSGDAVLTAHFNFAMLHGATVSANGTATLKGASFAFNLGACAPATLNAFHPGESDMAQLVKGALCPAPGAKTFTVNSAGWKFLATARDVAMGVPLGNVQVSGGAGRITFSGRGSDVAGKINVTAARMTDLLAARRFEPLTGTGDIALDKWIWHGAFAVSNPKSSSLGTASFRHDVTRNSGEMTISAPHLQFASDKLQPVMLSPLFGPVTRADGTAKFDGTISWTQDAIQSHGVFGIEKLDFLTPLGLAHAVNANVVLTSLLPPVTAPGQHIAVSRIDWTLPLSGIALDFSFGGSALHVESLSGGISEGNVHLGAITIHLGSPGIFTGAASLDNISLAPLVAASNLGSKIRLDGKVTGTVPFSYGPDGFRITKGHLESVAPGRISLDRSVWEGDGTVPISAVEDLAYQALENLAFDQLSADVNSIDHGRLQIVFHVKGHSDPPKPQQAEVAITDILDGSVFRKPIQLTSGTPISLTLDTSLNFDELLRSYTEAWSKTLAQTAHQN